MIYSVLMRLMFYSASLKVCSGMPYEILGIDAGNPFFHATERLGLGSNGLIHSVGNGHHTENRLPAATWKRQNQCGCLQKEKMNSQICRLITRMNPHGILAYTSTSS
jgi:hypothetical protein